MHIGLDRGKLCSAQRLNGNQQLRDVFNSLLRLHHLGAVCRGWGDRLPVPQKLSPFLALAFYVHLFLKQRLVRWGHGLSRGFVGGLLYNINIVKATNKAFCFLPSPSPVSSAMGIAALF